MITETELFHDIQQEIDRSNANSDYEACAWYCNFYAACEDISKSPELVQVAHRELVQAVVNGF
jgi:hypothetical protein